MNSRPWRSLLVGMRAPRFQDRFAARRTSANGTKRVLRDPRDDLLLHVIELARHARDGLLLIADAALGGTDALDRLHQRRRIVLRRRTEQAVEDGNLRDQSAELLVRLLQRL